MASQSDLVKIVDILPSLPPDRIAGGLPQDVVPPACAGDLGDSGEGEQVIAGRHAGVQVNSGMGRVILLGFLVQHRAQSLATFRLLFNAILTSR